MTAIAFGYGRAVKLFIDKIIFSYLYIVAMREIDHNRSFQHTPYIHRTHIVGADCGRALQGARSVYIDTWVWVYIDYLLLHLAMDFISTTSCIDEFNTTLNV